MTERRPLSTECLDPEAVACFVEGRLEAGRRVDVQGHIDACEECYELVAEAAAINRELILSAHPAPAVTRPARRLAPAFGWGMAALAASVAAVWIVNPLWLARARSSRPELVELARAVGSRRVIEPRIAGDFSWGPPPTASRGPSADLPPEVQIASAHAEQAMATSRSLAHLSALAAARLLQGKNDDAIGLLEEALRAEPRSPALWNDLAVAHLQRAAEPEHGADLPQALDAIETALALDESRAGLWFNDALVYERMHMRPQAIRAWEEFLRRDQKSPWSEEARQHLGLLKKPGAPSTDAGPLRERLFDEVLPGWAAQPDSARHDDVRRMVESLDVLSADRFTNAVYAAIENARTPEARASLQQGLIAYGKGRREYKADRFEGSRAALEAARQSLKQAGIPLWSLAEFYLGLVQYRSNDYAGARRLLEEARDSQPASSFVRGRTEWPLALIAQKEGRFELAAGGYESAAAALRAAGETGNEFFVKGLLATDFDRIGDPVRAWRIRVDSLDGSGREGTLLNAGIASSRLGWHRAAAAFASAAIDASRQANRLTTLADAVRWRAVIMNDLGAPMEARQLLAEARRLIGEQHGAAWDALRAETDLADAITAPLADAVDGVAAADRALQYFANADGRLPEVLLARARLYRALRKDARAEQDLLAGLHVVGAIRSQIPQGVDQVTFGDTVRALIDEWVSLTADTGRPNDAFIDVDATRGRDLPSAEDGSPSVGSLEGVLPERHAILDFVVGKDRTFAWVIRRGRSRLVSVPISRLALANLVKSVTIPVFDRGAAERLRDLLILPAADLLAGTESLTIIPDGPLTELPFALLPGLRGRYLVDDLAMVLAPSVGAWTRASSQLNGTTGASLTVFVAANPSRPAAFAALPDLRGAKDEATQISRLYPTARISVDDAATTEAFLQALSSADVVHFAGHALLNALSPFSSKLVLAGPGGQGLSAGEIRSTSAARARLVVLATCQAANGFPTRFEGPLGLARAFLAAGVPSVVASQWLADDRSSSRLMVRFHEAYVRHHDASRALREAQRSLIASSDPADSDPRAWAGYVAIGG